MARRTVVVGLLVAVLSASCTSGQGGRSAPPPGGDAIVVTSFNFPESALVAEIYAQALEQAGLPVHRELELGSRELVQPALRQGMVDVVPEYLGTALASFEPDRPVVGGPDAAREALSRNLAPWAVRVLTPAAAQNQNALVVTRDTAQRLGVRTISDLEPSAGSLRLGGPAECPSRPYCLRGLEGVYGLRFKDFVPFDSKGARAAALREGVVDVAVLFTTDAELTDRSLAVLDDDRGLQPPENVTPVVSERVVAHHGQRLVDTLDAVSAALTSEELRFLNWRVGPGQRSRPAEARGWLRRHGLPRPA